jgi:hypothetical protein
MNARDESGVVLGWLVKVVAVLSVLGLVLYELGAVTVNYFGLDTSADDIAVSLSSKVIDSPIDEAGLRNLGKTMAKDVGAKLVRLELDDRQQTLSIVLTRKASTLVVDRIPPLKGWAKATVTGKSGTE